MFNKWLCASSKNTISHNTLSYNDRLHAYVKWKTQRSLAQKYYHLDDHWAATRDIMAPSKHAFIVRNPAV